jgi:hypothetical protein
MSNLLFTGILALLLILVAHVGLKLYVFEDSQENLNFENNHLNNNNNNNNNNDYKNGNTNAKLWTELTKNDPNTHNAMSYGPAGARTEHAYQGKRGNFNGVVPNYPVLATKNEVHELQESLKKDLAGFLDEHSLDDYLSENKNSQHTNNANNPNVFMNAPTGGPVIGRPTKNPYKEMPVGVEERTYDGKYKSYENVMYGSDIEKYHKNDSVNPYTNDGRYYAPYDTSPIVGH